MKILTWNVNGIRAVMKKDFLGIMSKEDPDILCLQETKAFSHQMPPEMLTTNMKEILWHAWQRAWYAWTAICAKKWFVDTCNVFEHSQKFHEDGRITEVELENKILLLNCYFPNGGTRADGTEMLSYKLAFYDELESYLQIKMKDWYEIILTWDMNIVHTEIDIARPKENQKSIWFLPVERKRIWDFMTDCWLTDMFRYFSPEALDEYSRWSYRAWARERNVWRRIDYFMLSSWLVDKTASCRHRQDLFWSDHCPVELIINI